VKFSENMEVMYDGMFAKVAFVGESYITLSLSPQTRQSARLLVYREDFHKVQCLKDSEK
jgi:hypothetical protein